MKCYFVMPWDPSKITQRKFIRHSGPVAPLGIVWSSSYEVFFVRSWDASKITQRKLIRLSGPVALLGMVGGRVMKCSLLNPTFTPHQHDC